MKKNVLIATLALVTITSSVSAALNATVENYISTCSIKRAMHNPETAKTETRINNFTIESRIHVSKDKMEETEIYKYLKSSSNGKEYDVSQENGITQINYTNLTDTDLQIKYTDTMEISDFDDEGNESGTKKDVFTSEAVWRTLEKTDDRKVSLRISHLANGKEDKEQLLRTKIIINKNEFSVDTMTLNPQDIKNGDLQLLFQMKSCHIKKTEQFQPLKLFLTPTHYCKKISSSIRVSHLKFNDLKSS